MKDGETMDVEFPDLRWIFTMQAVSWLMSRKLAKATNAGGGNLARGGGMLGSMEFRPTQVLFSPDWRFQFGGGEAVELLVGNGLTSALISELALPIRAPSLFGNPPQRRSLLRCKPGNNQWRLLKEPWLRDLRIEGKECYEDLTIEMGENNRGGVKSVLVAESTSPLEAQCGQQSLKGGNGSRFSLPINQWRVMVYRDRMQETQAFFGHLPNKETWLHGPAFSAVLTGQPEEAAIEAVTDLMGTLYSVRPALSHIEVPIQGAVIQTALLEPTARLSLRVVANPTESTQPESTDSSRNEPSQSADLKRDVLLPIRRMPLEPEATDSPPQNETNAFGTSAGINNEDLAQTIFGSDSLVHSARRIPLDRDDTKIYSPKAAPDWYTVNIFPGMLTEALGSMNEANPTLMLTLNGAQMDVIRPADFLKLTFEFRGMTLRMRGLDPVLEPTRDADQALLLVHLPAQTIGEQAFDKDSLPDSTQAQSLLGGESLLVFRPFTGCGLASEDIIDIEGLCADLAARKSDAAKWVMAKLSPPVQQLVTGIRQIEDAHLLRPLILRDLNQFIRWTAYKQKPPAMEMMLHNRNYLQATFPGRFAEKLPGFIRYTLDRLLEWNSFELVVPENAKDDGRKVAPAPINVLEESTQTISDPRTAIEIPFRLLLSPSPAAAWRQTPNPTITGGADVELWRAQVVDDAIRAVYSRDYPKNDNPIFPECSGATPADKGPFKMSMSRFDRYQIVRLCSDFSIKKDGWRPTPLGVNEMALSTLGGWLDCDTNWSFRQSVPFPGVPDQPFDVTRWRHIATMGRDQYCRIEYKGYLYPLGHRAVLVKETKRVFDPASTGGYRCYLQQRWFVEVRQQIRTYPGSIMVNGQPVEIEKNSARDFPFSEVKFITLSSPPAKKPPATACPYEKEVAPSPYGPGVLFADLFIQDASGKTPFRFIVSCKDGSPTPDTVTFDLPLIFIMESEARPFGGGMVEALTDRYNKPTDLPLPETVPPITPDLRIADLHGQKLHYMPPNKPGDTELETSAISFKGQAVAILDMQLLQVNDLPSFAPAMSQAAVRIPSVALMAPSAPTAVIQLNTDYVQATKNADGTFKNVGEVFADVVGTTPLDFPASHGGGLATPTVNIIALSRKLGPVGGQKQPAGLQATVTSSSVTVGKFDPTKFFDDAPRLLGVVPLQDLLGSVVSGFGTAPKMLVQQVQGAAADVNKILTQVQALESQIQGQLDNAKASLDDFIVAINNAAQGSLNQILSAIKNYPGVTANAVFILGPTSIVLQASAKLDLKAAENSILQYLARKYPEAAPGIQKPTLILDAVPQPTDDPDKPKGLRQQLAAACAKRSDLSLTDARYLTGLLDPSTILDGATESLVQTVAKIGLLYQTAVDALAEIPPRELWDAVDNMSAALNQLENSNLNDFVRSAQNLLNAISKTLDSAGGITSTNEFKVLIDAVDTAGKNVSNLNTVITNQVGAIKQNISRKAQTKLKEIYNDSIPQEISTCFDISTAESQLNQVFQQLVEDVLGQVDILANNFTQFLSDLNAAATAVQQEINAVVDTKNAILEEIQDIQKILLQPVALQLDYTYSTPLYDGPSGAPVFRAGLNGKTAAMTMDVHIHQGLDLSDRTESIDVSVNNFQIVLLPSTQFLIVKFNQVRFTAKNGGKPDIGVDIAGIELGDCLNFVKTLQSCIPALGNKGNGPFINIDGPEIQAGYRYGRDQFPLCGLMAYNLAIEASVNISLEGKPVEVGFAFCSRERPFFLAGSIYGGGGFFAIRLNSVGVTSLEAAIEFGAMATISIGVASGTASLAAGIYFSKHPGSVVLSGFFRAAGNLDIAGIIHLSVVFYMGLTYQQVGDQSCAYGEVTVHVEISIAFFSVSYDLHATKTIAGGSGGSTTTSTSRGADVSHLALMDSQEQSMPRGVLHGITAEHWQEYRDAFELV
jgi:hypothetical protein